MSGKLEILPEGWVNPIRFGSVSYCGRADPGISVQIKIDTLRGERWAGGALTIEQAQKIIDHLSIAIHTAGAYPKFLEIIR